MSAGRPGAHPVGRATGQSADWFAQQALNPAIRRVEHRPGGRRGLIFAHHAHAEQGLEAAIQHKGEVGEEDLERAQRLALQVLEPEVATRTDGRIEGVDRCAGRQHRPGLAIAALQPREALLLQEQRFAGLERGNGESWSVLAASATIYALNAAVGPRGNFRLEHLQRQTLGTLEIFLAHLSFVLDGGLETLLGVSVVREDEAAAAARAVLDAANRRVERLLSEPVG